MSYEYIFEMDPSKFNIHYRHVPDIVKNRLSKVLQNKDQINLLDFGCNFGVKTIGLYDALPISKALGVDINDNYKSLSNIMCQNLSTWEKPTNVSFKQLRVGEKIADSFSADLIFSWSVFEHVNLIYIKDILRDLYDVLNPGGLFFLQVNPFFYSPFGSHLNDFLSTPWIHILTPPFQLKQLLFSHIKNTKLAESMWEVFESLNMIKPNELIQLCTDVGFKIDAKFVGTSSLTPPSDLTNVYPSDLLATEGFQIIFSKSH